MRITIKPPQHPDAKALVKSTEVHLKQFFKDHSAVMEADVRFQHGTNEQGDKSCEIYLKMSDRNIFAVQQASSFDSSFKKAITKLDTQIKKMSNQQ